MRIRFLAIVAGQLLAGMGYAAEPGASLPPLRLQYVSAFAGYPTHADAKPVDWSRSNALVGALQGHAGHWRAPPADHRPTPQPPQAGGVRP